MPERLLQNTLEQLDKQFVEAREIAEQKRRATELELAEIHAALSELEQRRQNCLADIDQVSDSLQSWAANLSAAQTQAVIGALQEGIDNLARLEKVAESLQDLEGERQRLLADRPELKEAWQSYKENSTYLTKSQVDNMPPVIQAAVLREAETIKQRVTPILELETKAQARLESDQVAFHILIIREAANELKMLWVTPVLQSVLAMAGTGSAIAQDLLRALDNAVVELARAPEWIVEKATRQTIADLAALEVEALYTGTRPSREVVAELLRKQLVISPVFQLAQPNIHVVDIPWSMWNEAIRSIPDLASTSVKPSQGTSQPEEVIPVTVNSSELFSNDDLRAWSAKVAPGSEWGMSARRIRTLFMRLLAHGCVGETSLESTLLWQGLPEKHATAFEGLVPQLIEAELLLGNTTDDIKSITVAINPSHLQDIQSLINREPSAIWGTFIQN